jgi:hypothetical protein
MQIIEIKRIDLDEHAPLDQKFKWLKIEKETLEITQLIFSSMDSSGEIEERFFEQGYLKFNGTVGTFIEKYNSAQHPLNRLIDFRISTQSENAIADFLSPAK